MTYKLKALGLALVAAFALSAMAASSASADTFSSAVSPAFLTGTQGATFDEFEVTDGLTFCEAVKYTGEMAASPATSIKLTPTYSKCKSLGQNAEINMKSCSYNVKVNDTIANDTTGTMNIECTTKGDEITIIVAPPTPKCIIHVEEQIIPIVTLTLFGVLKFNFNISLSKYSETKGSGLGACAASSPVTQSGGVFKGEGILSGFSDKAHTKANALSLIK